MNIPVQCSLKKIAFVHDLNCLLLSLRLIVDSVDEKMISIQLSFKSLLK
jgi:hypothetical protein